MAVFLYHFFSLHREEFWTLKCMHVYKYTAIQSGKWWWGNCFRFITHNLQLLKLLLLSHCQLIHTTYYVTTSLVYLSSQCETIFVFGFNMTVHKMVLLIWFALKRTRAHDPNGKVEIYSLFFPIHSLEFGYHKKRAKTKMKEIHNNNSNTNGFLQKGVPLLSPPLHCSALNQKNKRLLFFKSHQLSAPSTENYMHGSPPSSAIQRDFNLVSRFHSLI